MKQPVAIELNWNNAAIQSIVNKGTVGLLRMGYDIANQARINSPYKTGALRNSIRVEEDAGIVNVIAGGKMGGKDIRYAAIQEFGGETKFSSGGRSVHITGKHYMERARQFIMTGDYIKKYFGDICK